MNTNVGESISAENSSWTFKNGTAKHFDNHIQKSVPLYLEGHELICKLSDYFVHEKSTCYEIGASTGSLIQKMALAHLSKPNVNWVGIDCVDEMVEKAKANLDPRLKNVSFLHDDVTSFPFEKNDLIVSYYCIQFIAPYQRQNLINSIYESLNWGGAFLLFEKVRAPDARFQDYMSGIYTDYKLDQGYTPDEIMNKSRSLKRVLEPFSTNGNIELLQRAGFVDYMSVMKYGCFEGFLAIK